MPRISEMPAPAALTGLERIPVLQGGGADGNVGLPLLVHNPAFGGAVLTLRAPVVADLSATAEADPGAGGVRWNNADPHLATELYINDADSASGDLASLLATLGIGGYVYVQGVPEGIDSSALDNLQRWQVTSISAGTGYTKLGVTLQASGGSFVDAAALELTLQQPKPSAGIDRGVVTPVSSSSGVAACDASLGDYFKLTLSEDTTLTLSSVPAACTLHIQVTQGATPYDLGYPVGWDWGEGVLTPSMPTGAGKIMDIIVTTNDSGATAIATARDRV